MRNSQYPYPRNRAAGFDMAALGISRKTAVGAILIVALIAFEIFNFDTTRYALQNLLGDVEFLTLQWASILAVAFCSIDFAGLIRLFTPQRGWDEPKEVWYLMGAWLLGATMNAIMTWWAISLTLLNHNFGNEVLGREQLLLYVPIFVAVLVWLTRILFIGAFTVAGEHIFDFAGGSDQAMQQPPARLSQQAPAQSTVTRRPAPMRAAPANNQKATRQQSPQQQPQRQQPVATTQQSEPVPVQPTRPLRQQRPAVNSRVRQRPPRPNGSARRVSLGGLQAKSRDN